MTRGLDDPRVNLVGVYNVADGEQQIVSLAHQLADRTFLLRVQISQ